MPRNFLDNQVIKSDMAKIYHSFKNPERLKDSSFYITGASGMLASYLTYFLIYLNECHNYNIKIFANVRSKSKALNRFGIYASKQYFNLILDDVNNKVAINEQVDYIIHAASPASPQYYNQIPVEVILPNIIGTYNLLEYAKNFHVKSFLFFSSGSVYGSINSSASENNIGSMNFLDNGNSYGESKRCGEALCHAYFSEYNIPAKSIRIYHTYGPTMDIDGDKRAFSEFVRNVINNENIIMTSDGAARRAFCYITDAINAMFLVLLDGQAGESYNLANINQWLSIKELANILAGLYPEKNLSVIYKSRNDKGYKLSPERADFPPDIHKIMTLGWSPEISAKEGFKLVIDSRKIL